jgi:hypothetical protein
VILYKKDYTPAIGYFVLIKDKSGLVLYDQFVISKDDQTNWQPTHWHPLPSAPKEEDEYKPLVNNNSNGNKL